MLTPSQLRAIAPRCPDAATWAPLLASAMRRFEITSPARAAAFLAQAAHESAELTRLVENLTYSAKRLTQVWPKRFPTLGEAVPYTRNPEALAEKVYGGRMGNAQPGDGFRYRGRGIYQLTGRENYRLAGADLGLPLEAEPDRVAQPATAALTAAWFWNSRALNRLADGAATEWAFDEIGKRINGGDHGRDERRRYWRVAREVLAA